VNIWTVANLKGGVGKTTTALTLAGLAAGRGCRVVLVDLDPHCSLSSYFLREQQDFSYSAFNFFSESEQINPFYLKNCLQKTEQENLCLIPASTALASIDRQPSGKDGMGLFVARALAHAQSIADLIIVDAPPMAGVLMINAIVACQQLIIPVQTDYLGVQGLRRMLATLNLVKNTGYPCQWQSLIVPTLFDRRTHASIAALDELRQEFGNCVWASQIAIDTKFREASALGQLPHKLTMECSGVNAYRLLLDNLLQRQTESAGPVQFPTRLGDAL
jgi:chromosome partitioning protein